MGICSRKVNALDAVYIDVLFLVNLLIDGSNLLLTAWVRSIRAKWWRVLLAAGVGSVYAVMIVFPSLSFLFTIVVKLLLSLAMLFIAFGFGSVQHFVRLIGAFYGVNFAAAGAVLGFHYLFMNSSNRLWKTVVYVNGKPSFMLSTTMIFVLCIVVVGYYIYRSVLTQRRERALVTTHLAEVRVRIDDLEHRCVGLIDTGNQLYEPLTRTPVMVMEASLWQDALPASWLRHIREAKVDQLIAGMTEQEPFAWQDRLRLVPYRGVNRGAQFMLAIKPDLVIVEREGDVFQSKKVLIGLDAGKLVADGTYRAIIHPSLLQNRSVTTDSIHSTSGRDGAACSSNGN
ncbi:stage II sporulation protein GA (sporulation sigma-E factor processing peptidase) [Paenibacillus sp. UNC496MF]|uniref:sigma-E processing peptidase SpoIIGA n=1 Tax=Paenibacillus sp. UNC496MF TaxID=1502753 RepID=UPI0008E77B58|nr:sigma-E processing peptidase SpoIIGA [Paenibacillus sp. UNC496MF]SFI60096.1 stage II sporulation protein GA (sporulation sigma-E factor processing peptidase) [Paenibacillus sp. UNC496MF]